VQRSPVAVDRDDHAVIRGHYHHHSVQLVKARLHNAKTLDFSFADEVEPDACAVLEDTIPANEIYIVHAQVALRAALPGMPCELHLSLNGHCSTPSGGEPPSYRTGAT
jgi:hypothetical protein